MSKDTTDDGGQEQHTNSIAEALGMDIDEVTGGLDFDFSEDGEEYDQWTDRDRTMAFDIVWDMAGVYPPTIDDDVVDAIIDDTDHHYRIEIDGEMRETGVTGIAIMAWNDPDASVEVDDGE